MTTRVVVVAVAFVGAAATAPACGGQSVVIGSDPDPRGGTTSGGDDALGGSNAGGTSGGIFPTGGSIVGGAFPVGGSYGGTIPTGGTIVTGGTASGGPPYGGTSTFGGTSGAVSVGGSLPGGTGPAGASAFGGTGGTSGVTGEGGNGDDFDPYPEVGWEGGSGYRYACPRYGDFWGFTCWNYELTLGSRSCRPDGNPYCNACSCSVPCETASECPAGPHSGTPDCIASSTTAKSCFLTCDYPNRCPSNMTCTTYPGTNRNVCMWVIGEQ
ncbi:MAG TPA: hypothetical protein VFZ53_12890 [Polyangiaceae bacterium]